MSWAFYQFQRFLSYKAATKKLKIIYVNPDYTLSSCGCCR
ncbi:MAG: transposase [Candidatus Heimdallarchaeota archaeon]|nr:transposase [Candidatus Heimdallarchaeota archaeon]